MFQALTHIMVGIILMFFDGIYRNLKDFSYFFMFFPFKAQAVYLRQAGGSSLKTPNNNSNNSVSRI